MSDKKFLNKVKEFSEYLDHSYDIEKFKLKESYSQSLLVKATIGGSRGGDCWGGRTCEYDVRDEDIIETLCSSIRYTVMNFFADYIMVEVEKTIQEHLKNYSRYDYISSMSDDYDYYGNHTEEGLYDVPVYPLIKKLLDDEHFQIFKSYLSNEKHKLDKNFVDNKTAKRITELTTKIASFESDKTKEFSNLKSNIENYENILKSLKEKVKDFPNQKLKELKALKDELNALNK